jgi:hypothetical protein
MTDEQADHNASLPTDGESLHRCPGCNAPMREDQRYCLECGARRGTPRIDFAAFWRRAGGESASRADSTSTAGATGADGRPTRWLPSPKLGALLTCVVLAAGIAVGDLVGPGPASSLASGAAGLPVGVLGAIAAAQSANDSGKASTSSSAEGSGDPEPAEGAGEASEAASEPETTSPEEAAPSEESTSSPPESEEPSAETEERSSTPPSAGAGKKKSSRTEALVSDSVLQQVKYVWVIDLSGASFQTALAKPASDPYLTKRLLPKGTLLADYSLVAASPLANDVALLSGQGSNADTEEDCPTYAPIEPPTVESKGLTEGVGCIYPAAAKTLADQASEAALTWKAYVQDMAPAADDSETTTTTSTASEGAATTSTASEGTPATDTPGEGTPATDTPGEGAPTTDTPATDTPGEGAPTTDTPATDTPGEGTPTTDTPATDTPSEGAPATSTPATTTSLAEASTQTCRRPALGGAEPASTPTDGADYLLYRNPFVFFDSLLESGACSSNDVDLTALKGDLAEPKQTPNLSWIVPSACHDAQDFNCGAGGGGLGAADNFLHEVVPRILASRDYAEHGLIVITFDSGPIGKSGASEANAKVGALLISPFVKARNTDEHTFTTYSLLMSIERLYGVPLLGHANDEGLEELGAGVYSTSAKTARAAANPRHEP